MARDWCSRKQVIQEFFHFLHLRFWFGLDAFRSRQGWRFLVFYYNRQSLHSDKGRTTGGEAVPCFRRVDKIGVTGFERSFSDLALKRVLRSGNDGE